MTAQAGPNRIWANLVVDNEGGEGSGGRGGHVENEQGGGEIHDLIKEEERKSWDLLGQKEGEKRKDPTTATVPDGL